MSVADAMQAPLGEVAQQRRHRHVDRIASFSISVMSCHDDRSRRTAETPRIAASHRIGAET
jgi:hypothetical protein